MFPSFSLSIFLLMIQTFNFKSNDLTHLQKNYEPWTKKVKKWLDANRPALNIDETNFVIFHSSSSY